MPKVSVTVITLNEAEHIAAAVDSAAWADEVVVVDCGSTDGTADIARAKGVTVLSREWSGYVDQKNYAAEQVSHDWIFSLDADERIRPELATEIRALLSSEPSKRGYRVPRVTFHLGRWIRTLLHDLEPYSYRALRDHLDRVNHYTTLAARQMREAGHRAGPLDLLVHPPAAFLRNYVLRRGILDGTAGLTISLVNAYSVFLKFAKLWELQETPGSTVDQSEPNSRT